MKNSIKAPVEKGLTGAVSVCIAQILTAIALKYGIIDESMSTTVITAVSALLISSANILKHNLKGKK